MSQTTFSDEDYEEAFGENTYDGPVYPLPQQYVAQPPVAGVPLYAQKLGPLPLWGWGALALAGGGIALYVMGKDGAEEVAEKVGKAVSNRSHKALPSKSGSSGSWSPSRSSFAQALEKHLKKSGKSGYKIHADADEAKAAGVKNVSPLITLEGVSVSDIESIAKKEGLLAVDHEGCVGLYPLDGSSRGAEWEEYIDALREDGQSV